VPRDLAGQTTWSGRSGNLAGSELIPAVRVTPRRRCDRTEAASVGSVRRLYERFRLLIHELAKFGIIGLIGVFANNLLYHWLHFSHGLGSTSAAILSGAITTAMSYVGNRYWSFRHRERAAIPRETTMFFLLNGVGLIIQTITVAVITHGLGMTSHLDNYIALNLGIVLGTLFRFWSYRKWVWAEPQAARDGLEILEPALAAAPGNASTTGDEAGSPH
jgi:putative flippase GtrA